MGRVYLTRDPKQRPVALKVLHPERAATLGPERVPGEFRSAGPPLAPHILGVLDSGKAGG